MSSKYLANETTNGAFIETLFYTGRATLHPYSLIRRVIQKSLKINEVEIGSGINICMAKSGNIQIWTAGSFFK